MIVVLAILGILAAIAVPSVFGYIEKAEEDVCNVNRIKLERMFEMYLSINNIDHSEVIYDRYLLEYGEEICPDDGEISFIDGEILCSVHSGSDDSEILDENDGSVPFL